MVQIKLGPPVSESPTRISKFYDPNDSEYKFNKKRFENCLSIGFKLASPWMGAYSYNHYTMFNLRYDAEFQTFLYSSSKSWNNPGDPSFPLNCKSALNIYTQRPR